MTRPRPLVLVLGLLLAACSGDNATSPPPPTLTGTWSYEGYSLVAAGLNGGCVLTAGSFTLVQTGDSLSGTFGGDFLVCIDNGVTDSLQIPSGIKVRGYATADSVYLDFDGPYWHHSSGYSTTNLTGGPLELYLSSIGKYDLTGVWTANKQ